MAQTKRKRQTKHRGNAAGFVESRGRTGRAPTSAEKSPKGASKARDKASARERRLNRYDEPPTWRGSALKALAAAVLMAALSLVLIKRPGETFALLPVIFVIYLVVSYYSDMWIFRRRQRSKAKQASGPGR